MAASHNICNWPDSADFGDAATRRLSGGKPVVMQDVGVKAYIDRKNCGDFMIS
jgi:hypothetical protein